MTCKKQKLVLTAFVGLFSVFSAWPGGQTEESDFRAVNGSENWEYTFDLSDYEPGKYNLLVRARDAAGNESLEGPINVFVDPESDRPTVSISNPRPDDRSGAVLTVIGTAKDDDGVVAVEVALDDRPPVRAEGTEFFSLALDLASVTDGEHTITAVAIDERNLRSDPAVVRFHLDKRAPTVRLRSHESGSLVNGRIRIAGSADDANGIVSVSYGVDDVDALTPLKLGRRKDAASVDFDIRIDTEERQDGPLILWFQATDGTGSQTLVAFLLFVDNQPAELTILAPDEETAGNGLVRFYGTVDDAVGIASLRYETGHGAEGEIPLAPGDPYWAAEIDFTGAGRSGKTTFVAVDATGNETKVQHVLPLDAEADLPITRILWPSAASDVGSKPVIVGSIEDDDGPSAVEYQVDRGEWSRVEASEVFRIEVGELAPGEHTVSLRAIDRFETVGPAVSLDIRVVPPIPEVSFRSVAGETETVDHGPGFVVYEGQERRLVGRASGSVTSVRYGFDGAPPSSRASLSPVEDGTVAFTIPLPRRPTPGRHDVFVEAGDDFGGTASAATFYYLLQTVPDEPKEGVTYITEITDAAGLYVSDPRPEADTLRLSSFAPFELFAAGGTVRSARLEPPSDEFAVSTRGSNVVVAPRRPAVHGPASVVVETSDGRTFRAGPFTLVADAEAPSIRVASPAQGSFVRDVLEAKLTADDAAAEPTLEVSFDGGESYRPLSALSESDGSYSIPLGRLEDGPMVALFRATDDAANTAIHALGVYRDSEAPSVEFVTPQVDDAVNGRVTIGVRVKDAGRLESVELAGADGTIRSLPANPEIAFPFDIAREGTDASIVATDAAGNRTTAAVPLAVDADADVPQVDIQLPLEGTVVRGDLIVSGMVFDDDAVDAVMVRLDGGAWQRLPGSNSFSLSLPISELSDNEHTVEAKAVDIGGTESAPVARTFRVSTREPVAALESPRIEETNRGVIRLAGTASDANGIAAVQLSLDNGASFQETRVKHVEEGTTWSYPLDTSLFSDGLHSVQLRVEDGYETRALYSTLIRVDNSPPRLSLDGPEDGEDFVDSILLSGRVEDEVGLRSVEARVFPIGVSDTTGEPVYAGAIESGPVITHDVPTAGLSPGWYNLSVVATDAAENETLVTRNVQVRSGGDAGEATYISSPVPGSTVVGPLAVSGYVASAVPVAGVVVRTASRILGSADVDDQGRFLLDLPDGLGATGEVEIYAEAALGDGRTLRSEKHPLFSSDAGPWVTIDSHSEAGFLSGRPFLRGRAAYVPGEIPPDLEEGSREYREIMAGYEISRVEVSLDNGRTFQTASGTDEWRYRVETEQLSGDKLEVVIRAVAADGTDASLRRLFYLDGTSPDLSLTSPTEGVTTNESLTVTGRSSDATGAPDVEVILRSGDKSRYQVPAFIQGLYVDVHGLGATTFDVGAGLTFFDDNVKLQGQVGTSPPGRFYGLVVGAKLLANVAGVPMSYLFGPDLDFLSLSVAVGANFSYFTMGQGFSNDGLVLGGMVGQIEFPTFTLAGRTFLNKISLYTEGQLWFISSDVEGGVDVKLSFGARFGVL